MRNTGVDELQARIKIGRRHINNLRCADDPTLMEKSDEELSSFLMRVKEESERAGLRLNFFFFLIFLFLFLYKFIYFNWMLITLQYCIGFAIHEHESAMGVHMLTILKPPPTSRRVQHTVLYICVSFAVLHTGLSLPSF